MDVQLSSGLAEHNSSLGMTHEKNDLDSDVSNDESSPPSVGNEVESSPFRPDSVDWNTTSNHPVDSHLDDSMQCDEDILARNTELSSGENFSWNPKTSLLELAYKLKRAEYRLLGQRQPNGRSVDPNPYLHATYQTSTPAFGHSFPAYPSNGRLESYYQQLRDNSYANNGGHYDLIAGCRPSSDYSNLNRSASGDSRPVDLFCNNFGVFNNEYRPPMQASTPQLSTDGTRFAGKSAGRQYSPPRERRHKCEYCGYQTDKKSHMIRHQTSVHCKNKPFSCGVCQKVFTRNESLREHVLGVHPEFDYDPVKKRLQPVSLRIPPPTDHPDQQSTSAAGVDAPTIKIELDDSLMIDADGESFCENNTTDGIDDESIAEAEALLMSSSSKEQSDQLAMFRLSGSAEKPYSCLRCTYVCRDMWHLKRHISDVHMKLKEYTCRVCRYASNRPHRLVAHMRGHGELFCFHCDFSTQKPDVFKHHLQLCSVMTRAAAVADYECRLCAVLFAEPESMCSHMREQHATLAYACGRCRFYTEVRDDFRVHEIMHSNEGQMCRLCDVVFVDGPGADMHDDLVHIGTTDDGMLACHVCGHSVADQQTMREHVRAHKPAVFACDNNGCTFKATSNSSLEMHISNYHSDCTTSVRYGKKEQVVTASPQNSKSSASSSATSLVVMSSLSSACTGTYSCPVCIERPPFKYRKSFEKHMSQHAAEVENCPLCSEKFIQHKDLQQHVMLVHGTKVV